MISFEAALQKVLNNVLDCGEERVFLLASAGRVLAENVLADRDFPPFDRSTKDGIAIKFSGIEKGIEQFEVQGVLSAGMAQQTLDSDSHCFEIMTGAVLPNAADTIVMYEETVISDGWATIAKTPNKGQNIHAQGSDEKVGAVLVAKETKITAAIIGVLASVGKSEVLVKKSPSICVVSTGNELVDISETPLPHQIRKSNVLSLWAALQNVNIIPELLHLIDERGIIEKKLQTALSRHDVVMLSGGVSKGKFDFIPEILEGLGVEKIFHRVAQRPGKPFWFGVQKESKKVVFSFPGNPVSTFTNYHLYFLPWLAKSLEIEETKQSVILNEPVKAHPTLTLFLQVRTYWQEQQLHASLVQGNGSGDLVSLTKAEGFICVPPGKVEISEGKGFRYISCS